MKVCFVVGLFLAALAGFVREGVCVNSWMPWNWNKPRPVDGQWSRWSPWSTCQITSDPDTLPFRFKERNCSNPAPKNGGADCKGESRRTTGCNNCDMPLGLESGRIQDPFVTALHAHKQFPASAARLNGKSAWCSMNPETLEEPLYLQIELKKITTITAVASQGFYPRAESLSLRMGRVSKYQLMYSTNGLSWRLYKDSKNETILRGNARRNGTVLNILKPEITARIMRVYPLSYFSFICMRLELYGCSFGCGGLLGVDPGNIITKSSPVEDQDCLWYASMPNITKLNMDFINFNIPCSNGYAELRDGDMPYSVATVLAQYCGYDQPPPLVTSSSGKLWVRFKSNASDPQVGFYSVYFPGCGGHLDGGSGEIKSPNFPKEYFHNSKCLWTITVPEGKSVRLQFVEFDVEGDPNRHRCPHDHLSICNGSDSLAPLIGKYCNSNPPPSTICSSGNTLHLKFHSDDALAWTGFLITYSEIDPLLPCSDISSTVVMPIPSRPLSISTAPLTPTPSILITEALFTQQAVFSTSKHLVSHANRTAKAQSATLRIEAVMPAVSYVKPSAVVTNRTGTFTGTSVSGELQAAAQRKPEDDDNDDDGLWSVIILSVFAFVVIFMIIASIVPSVKKHWESKKCEKEMNLLIAASMGIPGTNSKDTFELVPIAVDNNGIPGRADREAAVCEEGVLPVKVTENKLLWETPTVKYDNGQSEAEGPDVVCSCEEGRSEEQRTDGLDDLEKEQPETDCNAAIEADDDAPEMGSLKMSYEDLGSSFACEMQSILSQFGNDEELPAWNPCTLANGEISLQDDEPAPQMSSNKESSRSSRSIARDELLTENNKKRSTASSSHCPAETTLPSEGGKLESVSDHVDDNMESIDEPEIQPVGVSSHSDRNTAKDKISGSCIYSKDSGSENLHSEDSPLLCPGETSVECI